MLCLLGCCQHRQNACATRGFFSCDMRRDFDTFFKTHKARLPRVFGRDKKSRAFEKAWCSPTLMSAYTCMYADHIVHQSNGRPFTSKHEAFTQCCSSVEDGWPILKQHWVNASCLLGILQSSSSEEEFRVSKIPCTGRVVHCTHRNFVKFRFLAYIHYRCGA